MKNQPIALVTGATSGIGEATAYRLQALDYVVFAAGRNPEALDTLRSRGLQARALDVTDEAAVARLVEEIHADCGGVDVLVHSAGFPLPCPLEQVALSDLRNLFETNVVATLHLSQAVLPGMRARGAGRIVTIGSTGGRFTSPGAGAYHIVKYGVEALSLALRAEVAQFGVRVVLIDPTGVRTRFVTSQLEATPSYADDDPYGEFKRRYAATTRSLTEMPGMMVGADTVARAVIRAVKSRNPKPRYIVGASGKASVLARALLTDRMWDRVMSRGLST
ncbi:MAG: SDR family NAD(P)-dependent oxidoreductase [Mycobacterium sp.]|uniref:SDR family NAD(P)-dependent oxidoreductase n=1 Tax=Mycobacterium sp. TaxID=1785 RepID=UPI003BB1131C